MPETERFHPASKYPERSEIHIGNIYRERIMSAIIQASPLEKLSQEPLPAGDSCLLVIFGASGDLTRRKLVPGLYNLSCVGCMNPQFEVLGVGRTPMRSEDYRAKMREALEGSGDTRDFSESGWREFEKR